MESRYCAHLDIQQDWDAAVRYTECRSDCVRTLEMCTSTTDPKKQYLKLQPLPSIYVCNE